MLDELFFRVALLCVYSLFVVIRVFQGARVMRSGGKVFGGVREDSMREGRLRAAVGAALDFIIPASVILYALHPAWVERLSMPLPAWLRLAGAALSLVSLALLAAVHRALGRHWSVSLRLRDDHSLVTDGPYRRVRHPMYTALFGYMLGLSLLGANWVIAVPRAVLVVLLCARLGAEEAMMIERFGDEYRAYAARTGRFLPPAGRRGRAA